MKRSVKAKTRRNAVRDLFAEVSEGMEALALPYTHTVLSNHIL